MNAVLRPFEPSDFGKLVRMYEEFEPKGQFQGLPPSTNELIQRWLSALVEVGDAQFVVAVGRRIVGHSVLCFAEDKSAAELAIFMHQNFRGCGLGRRLLLGTLNHGCKTLELNRVWLSVQGSNPRALHLFESVGFNPFGTRAPLQWELEMTRPSHCARCKGSKCEVFGATLPMRVPLPRGKVASA